MFEVLKTELGIAFLILVVAVIVLTILVVKMEFRLRKLLRGKNAHDLESVILDMAKAIDSLDNNHSKIESRLNDFKTDLSKSVRHVRTVRYNPFQGTGGNQSFATAFLNDEGHGVVISGLYTRGQFNGYAKPIKSRVSEHELSEEERSVLEPIA